MKTVKLQYECDSDIDGYIHQYNIVYRYAFNRHIDNPTLGKTELTQLVKPNVQGIPLLDVRFIESACAKAFGDTKENTVIFGGKQNRQEYLDKKITKEEYQMNRQCPLTMVGAQADPCGNRKFKLDIENEQVIFKPERSFKHYLKLGGIGENRKSELMILDKLCKVGSANFTCGFDHEYVYITYEEVFCRLEPVEDHVQHRIMSLDLNPNYIAYVICDYNEVGKEKEILKEVISFKEITGYKPEEYKNWTKEIKKQFRQYQRDKQKNEIVEAMKQISIIAKHHKCEVVAVEKLNIEASDKGKGKFFNKRCNNSWCKNLQINNLIKRCNIFNIKVLEIACRYSSFIGQIMNPTEFDSVGAALEIGRRANLFHRYVINKEQPINDEVRDTVFSEVKNIETPFDEKGDEIKKYKVDVVYPRFPPPVTVVDQWKKTLPCIETACSWNKLYNEVKKQELRYRFMFNDSLNFFRLKSPSSYVKLYHIVT